MAEPNDLGHFLFGVTGKLDNIWSMVNRWTKSGQDTYLWRGIDTLTNCTTVEHKRFKKCSLKWKRQIMKIYYCLEKN